MAQSIMLDKSKDFAVEILNRTGYVDDDEYKTVRNNCGAIRRMLISSINTVKNK